MEGIKGGRREQYLGDVKYKHCEGKRNFRKYKWAE